MINLSRLALLFVILFHAVISLEKDDQPESPIIRHHSQMNGGVAALIDADNNDDETAPFLVSTLLIFLYCIMLDLSYVDIEE